MLIRYLKHSIFALSLALVASPAWSAEPKPLTYDELDELVYNKTADCRKEKDQSECVNFFSEEGELAQVMKDDGKRKDGRWFLDDSDRLCILWNGKTKPLCFSVIKNADGTYKMLKHGKHISSILNISAGNRDNL